MKTNIKMKCDDNQFRKVMDILKLDYNHRLHYEDMYIIINSHLSAEWGYGGTIYNDSRCEEIDADLFIRTNGTCEEINSSIDYETLSVSHLVLNSKYEELEQKLKKKNEILKKARIKRRNQREELHKLNLKLQKCIDLEAHNLATQKLRDTIISLRDEAINKVDNMRDTKNKEIEKLKAVIEYLESKLK